MEQILRSAFLSFRIPANIPNVWYNFEGTAPVAIDNDNDNDNDNDIEDDDKENEDSHDVYTQTSDTTDTYEIPMNPPELRRQTYELHENTPVYIMPSRRYYDPEDDDDGEEETPAPTPRKRRSPKTIGASNGHTKKPSTRAALDARKKPATTKGKSKSKPRARR